MKKILLTIFILFFVITNSFANEIWKNDSRTMFLNNDLIFLEINPRTFSANDINGNGIIEFELGETSGNFITAIDRLDEVKKLGINAIHVMPITPIGTHRALGTAGSLYAMADFSMINPQLDFVDNNLTPLQEFKIFVEECHKRNIRVIVDIPSCGSYDLYLKHPELFYLDKNQKPISPADWFDVYLYKVKNIDGTINEELYKNYKNLFDMLISANIDGIRADVATIKTFDFWKKLISEIRENNSEFLFLAEASNEWNTPPCKESVFTKYDKLLLAGFDGYYGNYFDFKNANKNYDLKKQVQLDMKLQKGKNKKSVIGSFNTHDELSATLIGGYNYTSQIIWLNNLLPLNPYFTDGIQSGDRYIYDYANNKAEKTYTDNTNYHVHNGKLDIFNFSRMPQGDFPQLSMELEAAIAFRNNVHDVVTKGKFNKISTNNKDVYAFSRKYNGKIILIVINKNKTKINNVKLKYKSIFSKASFVIIKSHSKPFIKGNKLKVELQPSEILILYSEK